MEKCMVCGAELPSQARFCGKCGTLLTLHSVQRSEESQKERAGNTLDVVTLPLLVESGPIPAPHLPVIQGTPQMSNIPAIPGTPSMAGNIPPSYPSAGHISHAFPHHSPPHSAGQPELRLGEHHLWHPHASHTGHVVAAKTASGLATKWVLIVITAVVVAVGGGAAALAYVLTRPQPVISISSVYTLGKIPAGSIGTTLHIKGQGFSNNSAITFLLDGKSAPGAPHVSSDQKGSVSANLPVTAAWPLGRHTLTAMDASNYTSKTGIVIEVVPPGQASTPGPFGAPADDASFKVNANVQGQLAGGHGPFTDTINLTVTGHPDPAGGTICASRDTGRVQHYSGIAMDSFIPYTEDVVFSCSGTYKGGNITYTETARSLVVYLNDFGAQITCRLLKPGVDEQLTGKYTTQRNFSGTVNYVSFPKSDFSCTTGPFSAFSFSIYGGNGNWQGTVAHA